MKIFSSFIFALILITNNICAMEKAEPAQIPGIPVAASVSNALYTLKIPISGTNQTYNEEINLKEKDDVIESSSLQELLELAIKEDRDFIIARVATRDDKGKNFTEYYELPNLHKYLFAGKLAPANPDTVQRYLQTPRKADIVGEISYFIYNDTTKAFDYFGNDHEVIKLKDPVLDAIIAVTYDKPANLSGMLAWVGKKFEEKKDYQTAKKYYKKSAHLGNAQAMNRLGYFYEEGWGLARDYKQAREWFEKSAHLGNAVGMRNLAISDMYGRGIPSPNYLKAIEWFEKALKALKPGEEQIKAIVERNLSTAKNLMQKSQEEKKRPLEESMSESPQLEKKSKQEEK